jgi:hypothetical protein
MGRVTVKPAEPLELDFSDGTTKLASFNNEAFIYFTDEYGPLNQDTFIEMITKPYDFTSRILHAAMKVHDQNVTIETARDIVISGGEELMLEISRLMTENFLNPDEELKINRQSINELQESAPQLVDQGIDNNFWETLYYSYCIKLSRPEEEFYKSTTAKTLRMLDIHLGGIKRKAPVEQVYSMRDFLK